MEQIDRLPTPNSQTAIDLDKTGATASLVCAIHCAVMPFLVTNLPLVGLGFLADEAIEWALIALSAIIGTVSLCFGFREHRNRRALSVLGAGLSLLVVGHLAEKNHLGIMGVVVVVLGGCTVASAHVLNRYLCAQCTQCACNSDSCA